MAVLTNNLEEFIATTLFEMVEKKIEQRYGNNDSRIQVVADQPLHAAVGGGSVHRGARLLKKGTLSPQKAVQ